MIRILLFVESLRSGGKERRLVELLTGLSGDDRFRFEVVLTRPDIHYEDFQRLGIRTHIIERRWTKKDPRLFILFLWIVLRFKPDIIHVWGHMPAVYALPAKMLLGIPMINNEIADATCGKNLLAKSLVFRFSDRIIANTAAGLCAYQAPPEKSTVIQNGFRQDRIADTGPPDSIRTGLGIRTPYAVAMVASFSDNKDYRTFIEAAVQLLDDRDDVTFLCVGNGDSEPYRRLVSPEHRPYILFPGRQSRVERLMALCDIGVLTTDTRHHSEGISNALLEFMALGKPVLATDDGGSPELITDNREGYLIPPYDARTLRDRIDQLLDRPDECRRLGEAGKRTVAGQFSSQRMMDAFAAEYLRLIPFHKHPSHENTDDRVAAL